MHKRIFAIFAIFATLNGDDEHETGGIGLSIVQKSVERYRGNIWIDSAPPRRGATFIFTWPTEPAAAEMDESAASGGPEE